MKQSIPMWLRVEVDLVPKKVLNLLTQEVLAFGQAYLEALVKLGLAEVRFVFVASESIPKEQKTVQMTLE